MKKRLSPGGSVKSVFVFALMAAFALMSLLIVILGAKVYRVTEDRTRENAKTRLSLSYIVSKVRSGDREGGIRLRGDTLVIASEAEGQTYDTYIYYMDGAVYEYAGSAGRDFDPSLGEKIAEVEGFTLQAEGDMLYIAMEDEAGETHGTALFVRTGIGEVGE